MNRKIVFILACCLALCCFGSAHAERAPYVAQIVIDDTISEYSYYYDHAAVLDALDDLIDDPANRAVFLYLNTPGGSMYEVDELYTKLMQYKEYTGRPVYAFAAQHAMSGGMYVAMAADRIAAARMSELGSIGVIVSLTSEAGLYEKLGIEEYTVTSGRNKDFGWPELTEEQRAFLQDMVDESFDIFVEIICASRGLTKEQVLAFSDGRVFTSRMARQYGLIDEVLSYEEALDDLYDTYGLDDIKLVDYPKADGHTPGAEDDGDEAGEDGNLLDWLQNRLSLNLRGRLAAISRMPRRMAIAR